MLKAWHLPYIGLLGIVCVLISSGCGQGTSRANINSQRTILRDHDGLIYSIAFSPNGQMLASGSASLPPENDNTVRLWDVTQVSPTPTILRGHTDGVATVAFSPDGRVVASGGYDNTVRLWDVNAPQVALTVLSCTSQVFSVAFSPDGRMLAAGTLNDVVLWDRTLLTDPIIIANYTNQTQALAFSPDSKMLAFNSTHGTIKLLSVNTPDSDSISLRGHESNVIGLVFSPDGKKLASSSYDGRVYVWNMTELNVAPSILHIRPSNTDASVINLEYVIEALAFSPDSNTLVLGTADGTLRLWNTNNPEETPYILAKERGPIESVTWSADGTLIASASGSNIQLWRIAMPTVPTVATVAPKSTVVR